LKYCIDCKHYENVYLGFISGTYPACKHESTERDDGLYGNADDNRTDKNSKCGPNGKLFEPILVKENQ